LLHVLAERGYSGGEAQLEHLIAHLQARGHDNRVLLVAGARFAAPMRALGVEVLEAPLRTPWHPGLWRGIAAVLGRVQPDVLHFGCGRSLLWGGLAARRAKVPLRVTTRRIDYPIGWLWRGWRYRRLVDHVVANCGSVLRRVLAAGVPPERVTLVHEGIDLTPWQGLARERAAARRRLGIDDSALLISCAASLRPRKGQRLLLAAFARITAAHPASRLFLAGDGSDLAALRARARALGIAERVHLPGAVRPVQDLYAASDVFCMPSFHEGLSNACLEASAAGLPLVVSEAGGLPEIVADGETGSVVPCGDVAALAAALARMLRDPAWRERAGAAGAERTARLFTHTRMAAGMEALFLRLLDAAAPQEMRES